MDRMVTVPSSVLDAATLFIAVAIAFVLVLIVIEIVSSKKPKRRP